MWIKKKVSEKQHNENEERTAAVLREKTERQLVDNVNNVTTGRMSDADGRGTRVEAAGNWNRNIL